MFATFPEIQYRFVCIVILSINPPRHNKVISPPSRSFPVYHFSISRRCVNDFSVFRNNSHVTFFYDNISCLNIIVPGYLFVLSNRSPSAGSQVTLTYAHPIQAPVYKTGTVKTVGALCSPYVRRANLRCSHIDQCLYTSAYSSSAARIYLI